MTTITLSYEAEERLEASGIGTADKEAFVNRAVLRELSRDRFEVDEIKKSIAEAEQGDFATDEEVEAVFAKYQPRP